MLKNSVVTFFLFFIYLSSGYSQNAVGWDLFAKAKFKDVYIEEYFAYASLLILDDDMAKLDGQEIEISGYHIPVMEENTVILSKYPNANCFFCGGAGMESILEVRLKEKNHRPFGMDERLRVKGTLKVNSTDWEYVCFILEDAILVKN